MHCAYFIYGIDKKNEEKVHKIKTANDWKKSRKESKDLQNKQKNLTTHQQKRQLPDYCVWIHYENLNVLFYFYG